MAALYVLFMKVKGAVVQDKASGEIQSSVSQEKQFRRQQGCDDAPIKGDADGAVSLVKVEAEYSKLRIGLVPRVKASSEGPKAYTLKEFIEKTRHQELSLDDRLPDGLRFLIEKDLSAYIRDGVLLLYKDKAAQKLFKLLQKYDTDQDRNTIAAKGRAATYLKKILKNLRDEAHWLQLKQLAGIQVSTKNGRTSLILQGREVLHSNMPYQLQFGGEILGSRGSTDTISGSGCVLLVTGYAAKVLQQNNTNFRYKKNDVTSVHNDLLDKKRFWNSSLRIVDPRTRTKLEGHLNAKAMGVGFDAKLSNWCNAKKKNLPVSKKVMDALSAKAVPTVMFSYKQGKSTKTHMLAILGRVSDKKGNHYLLGWDPARKVSLKGITHTEALIERARYKPGKENGLVLIEIEQGHLRCKITRGRKTNVPLKSAYVQVYTKPEPKK